MKPTVNVRIESMSKITFPRPISDYRFGMGSLLVFVLALVLQIISYDPLVNVYDEGIILVGADSVARGKLPYKDFWTMYGPGSFFLASYLFSALEQSAVVTRAIGITSKSLIVVLVYVIINRFANRLLALGGAATVLGIVIGMHQDAFPIFPAIAFALGSIILLGRGSTYPPINFVAAGLCTGLVACFRHDLGAYIALAATLTMLVASSHKTPSSENQSRSIIAAKSLGFYIVGILLVSAPIAFLLWKTVPLSDLYENLIFIPSNIYPGMRHLPWPGIDQIWSIASHPSRITEFAVYVPFLVCAPILAIEIFRLRRPRKPEQPLGDSDSAASHFLLLASLTCLLFTLKGMVRVSNFHMIQSLVLSVPLLLVVISRGSLSSRLSKTLVLAVTTPSFALLALLSIPGIVAASGGIRELLFEESNKFHRCINPELPALRCVSADQDYIKAAKFVREHTASSDRIYVGVGRHDKIFANAVALYFFAERPPATKWYELHPGVQTQARIQSEMIAEMDAYPPQLIVLDNRWDRIEEPNLSRISSGVTLLDTYLERRYAETVRFGTVRILAPR